MEHRLKEPVENIFKSFTALENVDHQLLTKRGENAFSGFVKKNLESLPSSDQNRIKTELFGWGPIEPLRNRDDLFDIMIHGPQSIHYEDSRGLHCLEDHFISPQTFQNFVDLLCEEAGMIANRDRPFADGKIGPFRIHLAVPPATEQISITLRKHSREVRSLEQLLDQTFLTSLQYHFFLKLLKKRKNFLVVGPTGSGKTSFLNSLVFAMQEKERLVFLEDTDELKTKNSLSVKLLTRPMGISTLTPLTLQDLIRQALRMRPDRLVVGEIRGQEAKDLLQALATGHDGSFATLHARTAREALIRLEMLIQQGAPHWSLHSVRHLIQLSLDYIIVLKADRLKKGVAQICQVGSHESHGLLLDDQTDHPVIEY